MRVLSVYTFVFWVVISLNATDTTHFEELPNYLIQGKFDTIVLHSFKNEEDLKISVINFETNNTLSYLPTSLSQENLITSEDPKGLMTEREKAKKEFDLQKFPISTNLALLYEDELDTDQKAFCSATMIGKNLALTAAHCVGKYDTVSQSFLWKTNKNIVVSPVYSRGKIDSVFGISRVKSMAISQQYFTNQSKPGGNQDIAILILETDLGYKTGWMGLEYEPNSESPTIFNLIYDLPFTHKQTSFYERNCFHFSYPGQENYKGYDLYFHTGLISHLHFYGGFYTGQEHIVGESGSSFFHINSDNQPIIFGINTTVNIQAYIPENFINAVLTLEDIDNPITATDDWHSNHSKNIVYKTADNNVYKLEPTNLAIQNISLINMQGHVFNIDLKDDWIIDLNNHKKGMYVVHVLYQNQTTHRQKIQLL